MRWPALGAWALGSAIEGLASVIVIWRFTGRRTLSEASEARAGKAVAVSFFLLAPFIAVQATRDLLTVHHSQASTLGIVLTAASVVVMPVLGVAKQRLGRTLGSGATASEGIQNLLCAAQAAAVLMGLALTAAVGWWWLDPIIGLALAAVAVYEGVEAWHGRTVASSREAVGASGEGFRCVRPSYGCPKRRLEQSVRKRS